VGGCVGFHRYWQSYTFLLGGLLALPALAKCLWERGPVLRKTGRIRLKPL
jgi:hypothetical protein